MMDVLLGQSYFLKFDPKLWQAMQPYPPLGTLYAASYLRQRGFSVALFDAMLAESETEWAAALDHHQPRFAVLYEDNFNYLSKMCLLRMRQAAVTMIRLARERQCQVIVAGADATDHPDVYLAAGADYVVLGEGELTLAELLDRLSGPGPVTEVAGLAWATAGRDGPVATTGRRPAIRDLDSLPWPAWDLVNVERYRAIWQQRHGYFSMNLITTRGCPFQCNWCAKPIWGQRYAVRSPEQVAREMAWLAQEYQPDHLWFADDILGLQPRWVEQWAAALQTAQIRIPFRCLTRADLVTEPMAAALAAAGAQTVWLGAESGSQKILDAMDKGIQVEHIRTARQRLRVQGVRVAFFLQFGYPGETWADIQLTLQLVRECRPDDIGISVSYPLPGTRFYDRIRAELGAQHNWLDSADLAVLYQGPYPTEFYRTLHGRVHHEFRWQRLLSTPAAGWNRYPRALYHLAGWARAEWRLRHWVSHA